MKICYISVNAIKLIVLSFLFKPIITQSFLESIIQSANDAFVDLNEARNGRLLVSNLDRLRGIMLLARHLSLWQVNLNINDLYRNNRLRGKMQPIIPDDVDFPCNLNNTRSIVPPMSVNELRPGDIDIIAAIGDSLTAGNAILSSSIVHIINEHRGLVFSGGGFGTWRNILTLPNILKVFNPNLYGYSTGDGLVVDSVSRLNIAEPMLMSRDLPYQASVLVSRMRRDPNIDMKNHWKLLTIFNGCNDICTDMCHYKSISEFLLRHERDLHRTFTILRDNVPRLLINLLPAPNMVTTLFRMQNAPLLCYLVHSIGCSCVFSERFNETDMQRISQQIYLWQKTEERIAALPEFQTNDFAIVYHSFTESPSLRTLRNGDTDFRYFANDCFHFSQIGQASMANSLWNSMMQPLGRKQTQLTDAFHNFECPTEERPYIATIGNS